MPRRIPELGLFGGWMLAITVLCSMCTPEIVGAGPESRRHDREIRIFEQILNTMLVDSPNFLVRTSDNARGRYDRDRGAVFSITTSLVGGDHESGRGWWRIWDDGRVIGGGEWDDDGRGDRERRRDSALSRQERRYENAKEELVETIADFGEILGSLNDEDWLEIDVRLKNARYFREHDLRRLTVRAKMKDVRAFSDGALNLDQLTSRIEMEAS